MNAVFIGYVIVVLNIVACLAWLLYKVHSQGKWIETLEEELATNYYPKPERVSDELHIDDIFKIEHGRVFFNAKRFAIRNSINLKDDRYDQMNIFDNFDLIDFQARSRADMFRILLSGDKKKIDAMMIAASYFGDGVPYIRSFSGQYYTEPVIAMCLAHLNMMDFVTCDKIFTQSNRDAVSTTTRRVYTLNEILKCSRASKEVVEWFISYDQACNVIIMWRLFRHQDKLYNVRDDLGESLCNDIYTFRFILTIGAIKFGMSLPRHYYTVSPQTFDIYDGKIKIDANLRVVK